MMLSLVTAPTVEPVTVEDAYTHLRLDTADVGGGDTAAEVTRKIAAARGQVERITRRALLSQTWDLYLDAFPAGAIELPKPPLRSVTAITYKDTSGVWQTLAASAYVVSAPAGPTAERGQISLAYGQTWPSTYSEANVVKVRFVAGYGTTEESVPEDVRAAVLLVLGDLYERRTGESHERAAVDALLHPYRSVRWA